MPTITTADGTEIFYKDWDAGRPVVFSHGWPLNADAWDNQAKAVADAGYRAVAHDRRGHGRSTQTWDGHHMDQYADDLAEVIEQLDLRDAVLVGHSTGVGEVTRYLGRHGTDRVAKAVLLGVIPPLMLRTDENPEGTPSTRLTAFAPASPMTGRSSTPSCPCPSTAQTATAPTSRRDFAARSGCGPCRSASRQPSTASRRSPRPTSPETSPRLTSPS